MALHLKQHSNIVLVTEFLTLEDRWMRLLVGQKKEQFTEYRDQVYALNKEASHRNATTAKSLWSVHLYRLTSEWLEGQSRYGE